MGDRRDFIKKTALVSGGLSFSFLGCEDVTEDIVKTIINQNPILEESAFDKYKLSINSPPYFERDYHLDEVVSNKYGYFDFISGDKRYVIAARDFAHGKNVSGIEGVLYKNKLDGAEFLSINDSKKDYLPDIFIPKHDGSENVLNLFHKDVIFTGGRVAGGYGDYVSRVLKVDLPSFQIAKADDMPGYIYWGDWSFENLKDVNNILKHSSLALAVVPPFAPAALAVYGVLNVTGNILDNIDFFIDSLNFVGKNANLGVNFDKEQAYSIYYSPSKTMQNLFLFPSYYKNAKSSEDIRNLIPLQPGNSLEFTDGQNDFSLFVKGNKSVKGKDLISIVHSNGTEEYFGFNGNVLGYYGLKDPTVGNIYFDPVIILGDENVHKGKIYKSDSKIISEIYPEISGTIKGGSVFEYRENLIVPAGPFGDCFKLMETQEINMKNNNTGVTASDSFVFSHWYARNIGKVKQEGEGFNYELTNFDINGVSSSNGRISKADSQNGFLNSLSDKIVESIKSLI